MIYFDRIDFSEGINVAKINNKEECTVCHYWYFNHGFKFQKSYCNGCNNVLMLCLNITDITIITVKSSHYC